MTDIIRRTRRISSVSVPLTEYQKVEYLESTGLQYFDTRVECKEEISIILDIKINELLNGDRVFGAVQQISGDYYRYYWAIEANGWNFGHGADKKINTSYDTNRHIVEYNTTTSERRGVWIDNTQVLRNFTEYINLTFTMYLFASQDSDGNKPARPCRCRIYSVAIYQNNNLIREFIPCYRKNDFVAGMYERVEGVFYSNAGTGEFIVGPDVN